MGPPQIYSVNETNERCGITLIWWQQPVYRWRSLASSGNHVCLMLQRYELWVIPFGKVSRNTYLFVSQNVCKERLSCTLQDSETAPNPLRAYWECPSKSECEHWDWARMCLWCLIFLTSGCVCSALFFAAEPNCQRLMIFWSTHGSSKSTWAKQWAQ